MPPARLGQRAAGREAMLLGAERGERAGSPSAATTERLGDPSVSPQRPVPCFAPPPLAFNAHWPACSVVRTPAGAPRGRGLGLVKGTCLGCRCPTLVQARVGGDQPDVSTWMFLSLFNPPPLRINGRNSLG